MFNVQQALADGVSYAEIAAYLAEKNNFNLDAAVADGVSYEDIVAYLAEKSVDEPTQPEEAAAPVQPEEPAGVMAGLAAGQAEGIANQASAVVGGVKSLAEDFVYAEDTRTTAEKASARQRADYAAPSKGRQDAAPISTRPDYSHIKSAEIDTYDPALEYTRGAAAGYRKTAEEGTPENYLGRLGYEGVTAIGKMGQSILVGVITKNPNLALGTMALTVAPDAYEQELARSGDEGAAKAKAVIATIAELGPEKLWGVWDKALGAKGLKDLLYSSALEAGSEVTTEEINIVTEYLMGEGDSSDFWDIMKRFGHSGLLGGLLGFTMGGASVPSNRRAARIQEEEQNNLRIAEEQLAKDEAARRLAEQEANQQTSPDEFAYTGTDTVEGNLQVTPEPVQMDNGFMSDPVPEAAGFRPVGVQPDSITYENPFPQQEQPVDFLEEAQQQEAPPIDVPTFEDLQQKPLQQTLDDIKNDANVWRAEAAWRAAQLRPGAREALLAQSERGIDARVRAATKEAKQAAEASKVERERRWQEYDQARQQQLTPEERLLSAEDAIFLRNERQAERNRLRGEGLLPQEPVYDIKPAPVQPITPAPAPRGPKLGEPQPALGQTRDEIDPYEELSKRFPEERPAGVFLEDIEQPSIIQEQPASMANANPFYKDENASWNANLEEAQSFSQVFGPEAIPYNRKKTTGKGGKKTTVKSQWAIQGIDPATGNVRLQYQGTTKGKLDPERTYEVQWTIGDSASIRPVLTDEGFPVRGLLGEKGIASPTLSVPPDLFKQVDRLVNAAVNAGILPAKFGRKWSQGTTDAIPFIGAPSLENLLRAARKDIARERANELAKRGPVSPEMRQQLAAEVSIEDIQARIKENTNFMLTFLMDDAIQRRGEELVELRVPVKTPKRNEVYVPKHPKDRTPVVTLISKAAVERLKSGSTRREEAQQLLYGGAIRQVVIEANENGKYVARTTSVGLNNFTAPEMLGEISTLQLNEKKAAIYDEQLALEEAAAQAEAEAALVPELERAKKGVKKAAEEDAGEETLDSAVADRQDPSMIKDAERIQMQYREGRTVTPESDTVGEGATFVEPGERPFLESRRARADEMQAGEGLISTYKSETTQLIRARMEKLFDKLNTLAERRQEGRGNYLLTERGIDEFEMIKKAAIADMQEVIIDESFYELDIERAGEPRATGRPKPITQIADEAVTAMLALQKAEDSTRAKLSKKAGYTERQITAEVLAETYGRELMKQVNLGDKAAVAEAMQQLARFNALPEEIYTALDIAKAFGEGALDIQTMEMLLEGLPEKISAKAFAESMLESGYVDTYAQAVELTESVWGEGLKAEELLQINEAYQREVTQRVKDEEYRIMAGNSLSDVRRAGSGRDVPTALPAAGLEDTLFNIRRRARRDEQRRADELAQDGGYLDDALKLELTRAEEELAMAALDIKRAEYEAEVTREDAMANDIADALVDALIEEGIAQEIAPLEDVTPVEEAPAEPVPEQLELGLRAEPTFPKENIQKVRKEAPKKTTPEESKLSLEMQFSADTRNNVGSTLDYQQILFEGTSFPDMTNKKLHGKAKWNRHFKESGSKGAAVEVRTTLKKRDKVSKSYTPQELALKQALSTPTELVAGRQSLADISGDYGRPGRLASIAPISPEAILIASEQMAQLTNKRAMQLVKATPAEQIKAGGPSVETAEARATTTPLDNSDPVGNAIWTGNAAARKVHKWSKHPKIRHFFSGRNRGAPKTAAYITQMFKQAEGTVTHAHATARGAFNLALKELKKGGYRRDNEMQERAVNSYMQGTSAAEVEAKYGYKIPEAARVHLDTVMSQIGAIGKDSSALQIYDAEGAYAGIANGVPYLHAQTDPRFTDVNRSETEVQALTTLAENGAWQIPTYEQAKKMSREQLVNELTNDEHGIYSQNLTARKFKSDVNGDVYAEVDYIYLLPDGTKSRTITIGRTYPNSDRIDPSKIIASQEALANIFTNQPTRSSYEAAVRRMLDRAANKTSIAKIASKEARGRGKDSAIQLRRAALLSDRQLVSRMATILGGTAREGSTNRVESVALDYESNADRYETMTPESYLAEMRVKFPGMEDKIAEAETALEFNSRFRRAIGEITDNEITILDTVDKMAETYATSMFIRNFVEEGIKSGNAYVRGDNTNAPAGWVQLAPEGTSLGDSRVALGNLEREDKGPVKYGRDIMVPPALREAVHDMFGITGGSKRVTALRTFSGLAKYQAVLANPLAHARNLGSTSLIHAYRNPLGYNYLDSQRAILEIFGSELGGAALGTDVEVTLAGKRSPLTNFFLEEGMRRGIHHDGGWSGAVYDVRSTNPLEAIDRNTALRSQVEKYISKVNAAKARKWDKKAGRGLANVRNLIDEAFRLEDEAVKFGSLMMRTSEFLDAVYNRPDIIQKVKKGEALNEEDQALMDTALDSAAEQTMNVYPTFSRAAPWVKELSRNTVIGAFPTFTYEVLRTSTNAAIMDGMAVFGGRLPDGKGGWVSIDKKGAGWVKFKAIASARIAGNLAMWSALSAGVGVIAQSAAGFGNDDDNEERSAWASAWQAITDGRLGQTSQQKRMRGLVPGYSRDNMNVITDMQRGGENPTWVLQSLDYLSPTGGIENSIRWVYQQYQDAIDNNDPERGLTLAKAVLFGAADIFAREEVLFSNIKDRIESSTYDERIMEDADPVTQLANMADNYFTDKLGNFTGAVVGGAIESFLFKEAAGDAADLMGFVNKVLSDDDASWEAKSLAQKIGHTAQHLIGAKRQELSYKDDWIPDFKWEKGKFSRDTGNMLTALAIGDYATYEDFKREFEVQNSIRQRQFDILYTKMRAITVDAGVTPRQLQQDLAEKSIKNAGKLSVPQIYDGAYLLPHTKDFAGTIVRLKKNKANGEKIDIDFTDEWERERLQWYNRAVSEMERKQYEYGR